MATMAPKLSSLRHLAVQTCRNAIVSPKYAVASQLPSRHDFQARPRADTQSAVRDPSSSSGISSTNFNFASRAFSTTNSPPLSKSVNLPPRPKPPPESELEESFLKGSGPGGQKINKTNSAVQLKHTPTGLVVKCQETRSRSQNRKIARQLLADKLDDMARGHESRSSVVRDFKRKKRASSAKKSRRKYRKLDEAKGLGATADEEGEEEEGQEADEALDEQNDDVVPEDAHKDQVRGHSQDEVSNNTTLHRRQDTV
ncbi:RF-1 domain-containing protein [Astrocystis sublimbata]|nr:RF-1 domain-containing protein [Astrocystis sublimbata]